MSSPDRNAADAASVRTVRTYLDADGAARADTVRRAHARGVFRHVAHRATSRDGVGDTGEFASSVASPVTMGDRRRTRRLRVYRPAADLRVAPG